MQSNSDYFMPVSEFAERYGLTTSLLSDACRAPWTGIGRGEGKL